MTASALTWALQGGRPWPCATPHHTQPTVLAQRDPAPAQGHPTWEQEPQGSGVTLITHSASPYYRASDTGNPDCHEGRCRRSVGLACVMCPESGALARAAQHRSTHPPWVQQSSGLPQRRGGCHKQTTVHPLAHQSGRETVPTQQAPMCQGHTRKPYTLTKWTMP